ncbi:epoxide hydrolase family protein [Candidatus Poriferisocius sp.]|uniref:epoxide hydrolase family protein n=1 Tax=Candidatus Poriferisocius sp. TaxID=3101276 RepID=UPI003B5B2F1F
MSIEPFLIDIPQADLDDLHRRLANTRWPDAVRPGWADGADVAYLRELVEYWADGYDWRAREAYLNAHPQYTTSAAGERVHFYHVRSPEPAALPLVLIHGYMGSVVEFREMMGPLSDPAAHGGDPADAFHVVVPSLPGYGLSGPTVNEGVDMHRCADAIAEVMEQLGYARYIVQGGDWGALVTRRMAEAYPDRLIAAHFNMLFAQPTPEEAADPSRLMEGVTEAEQAAMARSLEVIAGGTGYMAMLSTKPQTLAMAHNDSPTGLAAWLIEKYQHWCDLEDGDLESVFTNDQLLDNVMLYWVTATAASSGRLYLESTRSGTSAVDSWAGRVEVPTGHAVYPRELLQTPRAWAERRYNIVYWSVQARGGHFAPFEQPALFTDDLRAFGRLFR